MPSGVVHYSAIASFINKIRNVSTLDAVRRCPPPLLKPLHSMLFDVSTLDAVRRCPPQFLHSFQLILFHVSTLDAVRRCPLTTKDMPAEYLIRCLNLRCRQALSTCSSLSIILTILPCLNLRCRQALST